MSSALRVREWLGRTALVVFGLLAAPLLLELALQLGAVVVGITHATRGAPHDPGRFRIVCLGDSNTFGLYLKPEESYPAQLEGQLAGLYGDRAVEVLNLGVPGLNSSRLLRRYPELLESLAPDVVIVMIGVNDMWTDPAAESSARPTSVRELLTRHSRVLRLWRLLRSRGAADVEVEVPWGAPLGSADQWVRVGDKQFDFGFERAELDMDAAEGQLAQNLLALRDLSVRAGARPLFMTYPGRYELYGRANRAIRAASQQGLPTLDLTKVFREHCPFNKCPTLLFDDQHPNAQGYRVVAQRVAGWLRANP